MKKLIIETMLAISGGIIVYYAVIFAFDLRDERIKKNCIYSCAQITKKYEPGDLGKHGRFGAERSFSAIDFSYEINGQLHNKRHPLSKNERSVKEGDKFLILISKEDVEKYVIMFEYPINDSADFKRHVKEFERMRDI